MCNGQKIKGGSNPINEILQNPQIFSSLVYQCQSGGVICSPARRHNHYSNIHWIKKSFPLSMVLHACRIVHNG